MVDARPCKEQPQQQEPNRDSIVGWTYEAIEAVLHTVTDGQIVSEILKVVKRVWEIAHVSSCPLRDEGSNQSRDDGGGAHVERERKGWESR